MSKYPTLTEIIEEHLICDCGNYAEDTGEAAAHISREWVRACTLTTVEALNELPDGAIIKDKHDRALRAGHDGLFGLRVWFKGEVEFTRLNPALPALLIWMPGRDA